MRPCARYNLTSPFRQLATTKWRLEGRLSQRYHFTIMSRIITVILGLLVLSQALTLALIFQQRSTPPLPSSAVNEPAAQAEDPPPPPSGGLPKEEATLSTLETKVLQLSAELTEMHNPALTELDFRRQDAMQSGLAHLDAETDLLRQLIYLLHDLGSRGRRAQELLVDQALSRSTEAGRVRAEREQLWQQAERAVRESAQTKAPGETGPMSTPQSEERTPSAQQ